MVNRIHRYLHSVENGWDPIGSKYAASYAELAWKEGAGKVVKFLTSMMGPLAGKRVLDLGGGPGQYSVALARLGADVVWHDISRNYMATARRRAEENRVTLRFSLGYLEDAAHFQTDPFDLVFCRICWCYSASDQEFSSMIYSLMKPQGAAYVETETRTYAAVSGVRKVQYVLNDALRLKIGHPLPPPGRIARLFHRFPLAFLVADYGTPDRDKLFFVKAAGHK